MNKNTTTSTFNSFITVLREEQKQGYFLQKFDYRSGYFCGVLSNDKPIPGTYHEALAAIDPESKELVLKKIMNLVEAANGEPTLSFVAEEEMKPYEEGVVENPLIKEQTEEPQVVSKKSRKPRANK